jgi:hypothetical protein
MMTPVPSDISARKDFIRYLKTVQPQLIDASKAILHKQYYVTLTNRKHHVIIIEGEQCSHKQFFALMLKQSWEEDDLRLIIGFCGLLWMISVHANKPLTSETNFTPIVHICEGLWKTAFYPDSDAKQEHYSHHCTKFCISGLEKCITIKNPLQYIRQLPHFSDLMSYGKDRICFKQNDLFFYSTTPFEHHQNRTASVDTMEVVDGEKYRIAITATPHGAHNTFRHLILIPKDEKKPTLKDLGYSSGFAVSQDTAEQLKQLKSDNNPTATSANGRNNAA